MVCLPCDFKTLLTVFNQSYNCQTSHYLGRNRLPKPLLMLPSLGHTVQSRFSDIKFIDNLQSIDIKFNDNLHLLTIFKSPLFNLIYNPEFSNEIFSSSFLLEWEDSLQYFSAWNVLQVQGSSLFLTDVLGSYMCSL